jgi:hypothetical protein
MLAIFYNFQQILILEDVQKQMSWSFDISGWRHYIQIRKFY